MVYQRDLTDRLTYFAVFFVVAVGLLAVLPGSQVSGPPVGSHRCPAES